MKTIKAIISCFAALVLSAQAGNVICIGLNDYANYPNLEHAENDATELAALFEEQGHTVTLLTAENVTAESVQAALANNPEFVYFAGHGEKDRLILADGDVLLSDIATPETTMLLDCCYIGRELKTEGTMRILAAAEHEAFESDGHGLFTKYLLSWLKDGRNLAEDALTPYLTKNIADETGGWQKPVLGFI